MSAFAAERAKSANAWSKCDLSRSSLRSTSKPIFFNESARSLASLTGFARSSGAGYFEFPMTSGNLSVGASRYHAAKQKCRRDNRSGYRQA